MLGVIANATDHSVVREFFELFKTPWEFYKNGRDYDVVLVACDEHAPESNARLTITYSGRAGRPAAQPAGAANPRVVVCRGRNIPLYGDSVCHPGGKDSGGEQKRCDEIIRVEESQSGIRVHVGYDLFAEVRFLLAEGQAEAHASIPTLDEHVAVLREVMMDAGVSFVEIPPVPQGHNLIACLTHDVDHPSLRSHRLDHTMLGFLYRAVFGSIARVARGRLDARGLVRNWLAALKLPLVHLGLARDFWYDFDRYVHLEKGVGSSFFVIPFQGRRGQSADGTAPPKRAARYAADQIAPKLNRLMAEGCEIGLHGIDAWWDVAAGRAELDKIRETTGATRIGARMHWLYFDSRSPKILDEIGLDYDSTNGYNETIGFRAGTAQAYKPLQSQHLMELPLHVMDTALFYPSHLGLSFVEAKERVRGIVDSIAASGGCLTVNWHDRSIAPERQWDGFYVDLLDDLRARGAWFATAGQAVSWFRKRRAAVFQGMTPEGYATVRDTAGEQDGLPGLQVRVYNGKMLRETVAVAPQPAADAKEISLDDAKDACTVLS